MQQIGLLAYKFFNGSSNNQLQLLSRVFEEQYKVVEEEKVELRPKKKLLPQVFSLLMTPTGPIVKKENKK